MGNSIDSQLSSWDLLRQNWSWTGILLGNGASRAIWDNFKYDSLYDQALENVDSPLTSEDQSLFDDFETKNFEQVLAALSTAKAVCQALNINFFEIEKRYRSIQKALFEAVSRVHLPWQEDDVEVYRLIRSELRKFKFVYSTNYDLIAYWSIMTESGNGFKDYFFSTCGNFDLYDTEIWSNEATKILYLHGGIHLARAASSATVKRQATIGMNLLSSLDSMAEEDLTPLFITEGSSSDKLNSIYRSDYLAFAYQQYVQHNGPLVVFGQSLGDSDKHLLNAMKQWGKRRIAVSVYPVSDSETISFKAELHRSLPQAELLFFDSRTHPLGKNTIRIDP